MLKTSNESLIFIYLQAKRDIGQIDKVMTKLKSFYDEKIKDIDTIVGDHENSLPPHAKMALDMIMKLTGGSTEEGQDGKSMLRDSISAALTNFYENTRKELEEQLVMRLNICNDLQTAYDILKEEMPQEVERCVNLVNLSNRF